MTQVPTHCPAPLPEGALTPVQPSGRSHLDAAIRDVAQWPADDREFFIATFASRKTNAQVAEEMGITPNHFQSRKREVLRRFMRAAQLPAAA